MMYRKGTKKIHKIFDRWEKEIPPDVDDHAEDLTDMF